MNSKIQDSDYSLDIAVAQAVEPIKDFYGLGSQVSKVDRRQSAGEVSPLQMWFWDYEQQGWYAGTVQDSMDRSMRAYMLFWERTGWRLARLEHSGQEDWMANLFSRRKEMWRNVMGHGSTAAIAICEAIKAASLADAEVPKRDAEPSAIL